jgi:hypothetical protein
MDAITKSAAARPARIAGSDRGVFMYPPVRQFQAPSRPPPERVRKRSLPAAQAALLVVASALVLAGLAAAYAVVA